MPSSIGSLHRGTPRGRAAATSFVGRRRELTDARNRLAESRLVTLTGPGGVGKTRLALELAERVKGSFADGVWLIELDSLRRGDRVAAAVATTLEVPDQSNRSATERVVDHLRDKEVLLVLDNCEHVLQDAADLVDVLLSAAPKVRVLATSREPLHLVSEQVSVVPPLATPTAEDAGSIDHFDAVALLTDRVRHLVPDFAVTEENRAAVAKLCQDLDGVPFALELAAVKLRSLSPQQLVERLDQRFRVLNRGDRASLPRQQTLRALIDWSYELCSPAEQVLWRRLAVFPDFFDLEAAEEVCGFGELDPLEVLDLLDQLVAKSIVQTDRGADQVRYRQLSTLRSYGAELLTDPAEQDELDRRHRDHYLARAVSRVAEWCGPDQAASLSVTRTERPNFTAALGWSLLIDGEQDVAAELAAALRYHWISGGYLSDGRAWLEQTLAHPDLSPTARGRASWVAAWIALLQGDHAGALTHLEAISRSGQDPETVAFTRHCRALHSLFTGALTPAIELFREAMDRHERDGRPDDQLTAAFQLVEALAVDNRPEEGLEVAAEALALAERHEEQWNRAFVHWASGLCHWQLGDLRSARIDARRALKIQRDFGDGVCTALSIELLSWVEVARGEVERGRELARTARGVWDGLGTDIAAFGPHLAEMSEEMSEASARAAGPEEDPVARVSPAEAVAVALRQRTSPKEPVDNPLTRRELEIARLVAEGLTSPQIAGQLVISPRTVEGHVENIFTKLDFSSRNQIASWVRNLPGAD